MRLVIPTTVSGWTEKTLKTIAASADERSASLMPKKPPVLWFISSVKASAGRRLTKYIRTVAWAVL